MPVGGRWLLWAVKPRPVRCRGARQCDFAARKRRIGASEAADADQVLHRELRRGLREFLL